MNLNFLIPDSKKRKLEESMTESNSEQQMRCLLDPLQKEQLIDLLAKLGTQYPTVADEIRSVAGADPVHRKLFVRGLAWETTSETLCGAFREYGEIEEGAVIVDKATGKSRGYGFITYKHIESAQMALKQPSKLIDGRMAVCNLACETPGRVPVSTDVSQRKLYIGGLSPETSNGTFLHFFSKHGEIEEGSVTYDKETNRSRGFGFVTYTTVEAAKKAIDDPNKSLGGRHITVKYADSRYRAGTQGQHLSATTLIPVPVPPGLTLPINNTVPSARPVAYPVPPPSSYPVPAPEAQFPNRYVEASRHHPELPSSSHPKFAGYSYYHQ